MMMMSYYFFIIAVCKVRVVSEVLQENVRILLMIHIRMLAAGSGML